MPRLSPAARLGAGALAIALGLALLILVGASGGGSSGPAETQVIAPPGAAEASPPPPMTRTYYIAADRVAWDYAPSGRNLVSGEPFGPVEDTFVARGPDRIGSVYLKSRYREYTDGSFRHLAPVDPRWRHLGLLGPAIHAVVGDTIKVVFRNNTPFPASVHPHGVLYAKDSEGAPYEDGTGGADKDDDAVPPGGTHTYVWRVPERAGPGPMDGSSVLWMYHSHTDEVADTNAGLVGPIIVTRRESARADGTPADVDREIVTLFSVIDENASPWLPRNVRRLAVGHGPRRGEEPAPIDTDDDEFVESNLMHSINGYVYGNLPGLDMAAGERVRWYVMDLGNEVDLHTPHWHGNTVLVSSMRTDMVQILPGMMMVADMVPDDPGTWLFHCHVNDHLVAGMEALYTVRPADGEPADPDPEPQYAPAP